MGVMRQRLEGEENDGDIDRIRRFQSQEKRPMMGLLTEIDAGA
jgi:hypothetical protein